MFLNWLVKLKMFSNLVSKITLQHFLIRIQTQFGQYVFQEKYEVFSHLIKENKFENNKINKQCGQVRFQFAPSHIYAFYQLTKTEIFREKL